LQSDKSALVVLVPAAEAVVGAFRRQYDVSAICGLAPHVTILTPFIPPESVTPSVRVDLQTFFARQPRFAFSLEGLCGFPNVLYLAPEPLERFDALTRATVARFPGFPPYGGDFSSPVPHLTVAQRPPADDLAAVSRDFLSAVKSRLPLSCSAHEVALAVKRAGRWSIEERFPLGFSTECRP